VQNVEGDTVSSAFAKLLAGPARSENHGMYGTSMRENRESPLSCPSVWSAGGPLRER
jgi:hypothetical protein